jgi:CelD/BcsL family acetyltransferase involved in cellulose biosynthesis
MAQHPASEQFAVALAAAQQNDPGTARLRLLCATDLIEASDAKWRDLAAATETASAFAQPWFLRHALNHCDSEQCARLAVAELPDGSWAGALPIARSRRHGRAPMPNWHSWRHPNQFVAAPLVRTGQAELFWRTLLDGLSDGPGSELALCLTDLPLDDPASQTLFDLCAAENREIIVDRRFERPGLLPGNPPELAPKHRRRIASLERKLALEQGEPVYQITREPGKIESAIRAFLDLEQAGWKGRGGSALACSDDTRRLFAQVVREGSQLSAIELASLSCNGKMLAFSIMLSGQGRKYGFKMAYDEDAACYAPGLLLLNWITREQCGDSAGLSIDSCTQPGQQPVARLWSDSFALIDCRIALGGPLRRGAMRAVVACEDAYSWLKQLG